MICSFWYLETYNRLLHRPSRAFHTDEWLYVWEHIRRFGEGGETFSVSAPALHQCGGLFSGQHKL